MMNAAAGRAPNDIRIRHVTLGDAASVARIYNHYVAESIVTFEEEPVAHDEIVNRISEAHSDGLPWLVAEQGQDILGYAGASKWKTRSGYRFSVEVTVYVDPGSARMGIGSLLFGRLIPELKSAGVHAAMGGIALPNDASIRLHEKFGFEKVAHFRQTGFKFDRWIDVGYWQLTL
jgi:L-amino acid N-acyltransferase YncA